MSDKSTKVRAQMKSRFYYMFWGAATVSVLLGQMYVGSGYRIYSKTLMRLFQRIELELVGPKGYYAPLVPAEPPNFEYLSE